MQRCLFSRGGEQVDYFLLAATRSSKLLTFVSSELEKSYQLKTNIEPINFVGHTIHRDRDNKSITKTQPHFVGKILDLYLSIPSTAKYSMAEDSLAILED